MPITAPSAVGQVLSPVRMVSLLLLCCATLVGQSAGTPWVSVLEKLASSLSQSDAPGALEAFDAGMKDRGLVEEYLAALTGQSDVLCSIDVVEDKEDAGAHVLDVDWYMKLRSKAENGPTERRRERVQIKLAAIRGKWKIISLRPIEVLLPIRAT